MTTLQPAQPIAAGYAYGVRLSFAGGAPPFPAGCALRAEVRDYPGAPALAGLLTTESGLASIVDDETLELFLSSALTGSLSRQTCAIDLVRTDVSPAQWMGVQVVLPVTTPVTRSIDDTDSPDRIVVDAGVNATATTSAPPGVTIALSPAVGSGPWNEQQAITAAFISSSAAEAMPSVTRIGPAVISAAPIASTVFGAAVLTLFVGVPLLASGSAINPPVVSAGPTLVVAEGSPPPTAAVPAPTIYSPSPSLVTPPAIGPTAAVLVPKAGTDELRIIPSLIATTALPPAMLGEIVAPTSIASVATIPSPTATLQPPSVIATSVVGSTSIPGPSIAPQAPISIVSTATAGTVVSAPSIAVVPPQSLMPGIPVVSTTLPGPILAPVPPQPIAPTAIASSTTLPSASITVAPNGGVLDFSDPANSGLLVAIGSIAAPVPSGVLDFSNPLTSGLISAIAA